VAKLKMCRPSRAEPIPLFADYSETEYSRLFKYPILMMRPIKKPIISEIRLVKLSFPKLNFRLCQR